MITWPVAGTTDRWTVGTIYCLGKNYAAHASEMGQTTPRPPVVFLKPAATLVPVEPEIEIPTDVGEVHYEAEFVLGLRMAEAHRIGDPLDAAEARRAIAAYAVGLDLTLRDRQAAAKEAGEPWARAKGFPRSAPMGPLHPLAPETDISGWRLHLDIDGERRQSAPISEMTLSPVAIVETLSRDFPLQTGDLVFTGTPGGIGALLPGAEIALSLDADRPFRFDANVVSKP